VTPEKASVAIVGGGYHGLSLAFNLADRGVTNIVVLDAGYFQGGASGRNGALVRGGFSSVEWTRFFGHSLELWTGLSRKLGHNVMFTRRGYAIVAETDRSAAMCERALKVHREVGLRSVGLDPAGVKAVMPAIDATRVKGAIYFDNAGTAPHHAAMKAYLAACRERGVSVRYGTRVTAVERTGTRASTVWTNEARIDADTIVIAAGAHNPEVAALAGVELDGKGMRIEAIAVEPMRRVIDPGIALIDRATYLHQTGRGEIVGGCEVAGDRPRMSLASDVIVMAHAARHLTTMFPSLGSARVLRQWAGQVHVSSDFGPLLGPHPDLDDLWISAGWLYGVAGAPASGDLLAKAIVTGEIDDRMAPFAVDRRRRNRPIVEESTVNLDHDATDKTWNKEPR
jgi:sarcosine oxidase subunit beta